MTEPTVGTSLRVRKDGGLCSLADDSDGCVDVASTFSALDLAGTIPMTDCTYDVRTDGQWRQRHTRKESLIMERELIDRAEAIRERVIQLRDSL
jgi:hypothetical protein